MKNNNLVTGRALAEAANISQQATAAAVKRGALTRDQDSGLFNLAEENNRSWLKEKGIKISEVRNISKKEKKEVKKPGGRPPGNNSTGETLAELQKKKIKLQSEKLQQEIDIKNKFFLPTDFIETNLIRYIEKLHTNIERAAGVYAQELAAVVLNDGELTNRELENHINKFLKLCHETKIQIKKELENYEPQKN
jgi:DNA-binding transcriptional MerR regulator